MAPVRTERFPVMLSPSELAEIDGYRFKHQIGPRAEAVRRLIRSGLDEDATKAKGAGAPTPTPLKATN